MDAYAPHVGVTAASAPPLPTSPTKEEVKNRTKPIRVRPSVSMQQMGAKEQPPLVRSGQKIQAFLQRERRWRK